MQEVKGLFIYNNKQTNKNHPVGEKQTGWLAGKAGLERAGQDWTGQGWTGQDKAGHRRHLT